MLAQVLVRTPTWVYALFVALVYLGYVQSRPRRVTGARLAILPVALGAFSLYGVYSAFGASAASIAGWSTGVVLAFVANHVLEEPRGVTYDAKERLFVVPGSWIPLTLMMAMFFTRYGISVALARTPALGDEPLFAAAVCVVYGLLSGTFFARALRSASVARQATPA